MKNFILSLLLVPALTLPAFSEAFEAEAILSKPGGGGNFHAWILAATATQIRYKTNKISADFVDANISDFEKIFLAEPPDYSAAIDLYEGRKYKEAQEAFAAVKERCKPTATLQDNFHTLAAFYEMECFRHLGNYQALAAALKTFAKQPLTREHQLRQLDLYVMWDAVRALAWDRVLLIASERDEELLPGYQRAQVAYCKALALDNLGRGSEAIMEYNIAMTADAGASEALAQQSCLKLLSIYHKDREVQVAMKNWGTDDENKNSPGYARLKDGAALAAMYEKYLGLGKALPSELKAFTKYIASK
jgi:tetratricopeptide (TPR) repeat protein